MTADYTSTAIKDLRLYLWQQLQAANLFVSTDYLADNMDTAMVPIVPAQQIPEFNNSLPGKPYIVYDYEAMPVDVGWWLREEIATFMVISPDYDFINTVLNFFVDIFSRFDNSAADILAQNVIMSNNFTFRYTAIESIKSPEPYKNEGGIQVGHVSVRYGYTRKTDVNGRF